MNTAFISFLTLLVVAGTSCTEDASEALPATRSEIKRVLDTFPDVNGIAFDGFGYQNYRFCDCPVSREQLEAYRAKHPEL